MPLLWITLILITPLLLAHLRGVAVERRMNGWRFWKIREYFGMNGD